jgi:hypothetical protein
LGLQFSVSVEYDLLFCNVYAIPKTFYILLANDNRTTLDKSNDIDAKNKLTHDSVKKKPAPKQPMLILII